MRFSSLKSGIMESQKKNVWKEITTCVNIDDVGDRAPAHV